MSELKEVVRRSGRCVLACLHRLGRVDKPKCEEMAGMAGATMVTSREARKLGRKRARISFHRRMVLLLRGCSFAASLSGMGCPLAL